MKKTQFSLNVSKQNNNTCYYLHTTTTITTSPLLPHSLNVLVIQHPTTLNNTIHIFSLLLNICVNQMLILNTTVTAYHLVHSQEFLYKAITIHLQLLTLTRLYYNKRCFLIQKHPLTTMKTYIITITTTPLIRRTHLTILYFHITISSPSNKPP